MTSKYDRLADGGPLGSIATLDGAEITLTFAEVEAVVGPLPQQARHMAAGERAGGKRIYAANSGQIRAARHGLMASARRWAERIARYR